MHTRSFAAAALVALAVQGAAFAASHVLATGYDPMVHFVSEYALGPHAWIRRVGAAGAIGGAIALLAALRSASVAPARSTAFGLLALNAVLLLIVQIFPVDPLADAFADGGRPGFSVTGWVHVISGFIAAVAVLLAILLFTLRLKRLGRLEGGYRVLLLLSLSGPLAYGLMMVTPPATAPIGLYQRLFIVSAWLWQVLVGVGLRSGRLAGQEAESQSARA